MVLSQIISLTVIMLNQVVLALLFVGCSGDLSVDPYDGGYQNVIFAFEHDVPADETLVTNLKVCSIHTLSNTGQVKCYLDTLRVAHYNR